MSGVGRSGEAGGDGGVGGERLIEVGEIDWVGCGRGEVGLDEGCRCRTPHRIEPLATAGDGSQRLCLRAVGDGVVECGVGEADVVASGERGEAGGIAAQHEIEVAGAEQGLAIADLAGGEADFVGGVAGVAVRLRCLGEDGISELHQQGRIRF
jgi:hypothetical protein